jgi:predicted flap endonuclease-1-like 5' DNA nuclease
MENIHAVFIGLALLCLMLGWGISAASGRAADLVTWIYLAGLMLLLIGILSWAFVTQPWNNFDDWSEPLYTGHDHHEEEHEAHGEHDAQHDMARVSLPPKESLAQFDQMPAPAAPAVGMPAAPAQPVAEPSAPVGTVEVVAADTQTVSLPSAAARAQLSAALAPVNPNTTAAVAPLMATGQPPAEDEATRRMQYEAGAAMRKPALAGDTARDDLTRIEGIGPKIAGALYDAGVLRYAQLADMQPADIEKIVKGAGVRMVGHAATFRQQARLAADGKWDELKAFQERLTAGRTDH